jgi:hypothetical protein
MLGNALQVGRHHFDHRFAPAESLLLLDDAASNVPIEQDEFVIEPSSGREPRGGDPPFQFLDEVPVAGAERDGGIGGLFSCANALSPRASHE